MRLHFVSPDVSVLTHHDNQATAYISGPMRGLPDENHSAFNAMAARLRFHGFKVFNPAESCGGALGLSLADCMRKDAADILASDFVVALDGWQESVGALTELALAHALALPVINESLTHQVQLNPCANDGILLVDADAEIDDDDEDYGDDDDDDEDYGDDDEHYGDEDEDEDGSPITLKVSQATYYYLMSSEHCAELDQANDRGVYIDVDPSITDAPAPAAPVKPSFPPLDPVLSLPVSPATYAYLMGAGYAEFLLPANERRIFITTNDATRALSETDKGQVEAPLLATIGELKKQIRDAEKRAPREAIYCPVPRPVYDKMYKDGLVKKANERGVYFPPMSDDELRDVCLADTRDIPATPTPSPLSRETVWLPLPREVFRHLAKEGLVAKANVRGVWFEGMTTSAVAEIGLQPIPPTAAPAPPPTTTNPLLMQSCGNPKCKLCEGS